MFVCVVFFVSVFHEIYCIVKMTTFAPVTQFATHASYSARNFTGTIFKSAGESMVQKVPS